MTQRKPAASSLLRIPLVQAMLSDPCVRIEQRAIDAEWKYKKTIPINLAGFNPGSGAIYIPARSRMAAWLADPNAGGRELNDADRLLGEVLFATHDYLHVWAYRAIRELRPAMSFGNIHEKQIDFEDWVFCHLLTEAIATAGVDYWYLSCVALNEVIDVGTALSTLTTPYHERHRREYRKWNPTLRVQSPGFLRVLTEIYCNGDFPGFEREALRRSPLVLQWVEKELMYGRLQREYTRGWLGHVLGVDRGATDEDLRRPCAFTKRWQKRLVDDISKMLWALVKHGKLTRFSDRSRTDELAWNEIRRPLDFRFTNLLALPADDDQLLVKARREPDNAKWYLRQLITSYELTRDVDHAAVAKALDTADPALVRAVLRGAKRVAAGTPGPAMMFFLP